MTTSEQVALIIDERLDLARDEIAKLEAARAAMATGATIRPARSTPPRPRRAKRTRTAKPVDAGTIELVLADSDAMSSSAIAERTAGTRPRVLALLRELEAAGRVRRSGQRRGTRWHLITEEDRIAARAAELAARHRPAQT